MQSKSNSYRRSSRRNTTPVYLVTLLLCIGLWFVYKQYQKHVAVLRESENMLLDCTLLEARFRTIGDFFALYTWFAVVTRLENMHYQENGSFAELAELAEGTRGKLTIDQVVTEIEAFFQRRGLRLSEFISMERLREYVTDTFGVDFSTLGAALDTSRFFYKLDIAGNARSYSLYVVEVQDINLDADTQDFFVYQQPSRRQYVRFRDKGRSIAYAEFYVDYSNLVADKVGR